MEQVKSNPQNASACAYKVYNHLGFGFLETIYHKAMLIELAKAGLKAESEKPLRVHYDRSAYR